MLEGLCSLFKICFKFIFVLVGYVVVLFDKFFCELFVFFEFGFGLWWKDC